MPTITSLRKTRSKLLESDASPKIPEFKYERLPADKKRIRLLRLFPGVLDNPQIDCEIFEAEFDKDGKLVMVEEDSSTIGTAAINPSNKPKSTGEPNSSNPDSNGEFENGTNAEAVPPGEEEAEANHSDQIKLGPGGEAEVNPHGQAQINHDNIAATRGNGKAEADEDDKADTGESNEEIEPKTKDENIISYEAMSWRWGDEERSPYVIMIKKDGILYKKKVSQTLGLALKYLRLERDRILWIDAICINQKDREERSYQVSMMSLVYTGSKEVCVWLGEDDDDSTKAIKFIKEEICQLKNFDRLCIDKQHAPKWRSLLVLMQRAWFSRRWVVQEIALAQKATVYCGPDRISWGDLAIALELFVEVETATHRLSELMKKDDKFAVVPYWFEHVSELGASVLVNATARIFREHRKGGYGAVLTREDLHRRSLLGLEYLVTSLSIFDCGRPHDSVYALIAIAKDAAPHPPSSVTTRTKEALIAEVFKDALEQKPYPLDYNSPYPDVCKEFTEFCIQRCAKVDPVQALDILCRPWAKDWRPNEFDLPYSESEPVPETLLKHEGAWMKDGKDDRRTMTQYFQDAENKPNYHIRRVIRRWFPPKKDPRKNSNTPRNLPVAPNQDNSVADITDLGLPSWVATTAAAPFDIFPHPGMDMVKMGRKNADPLVGTPQDGHRNYNAGQSNKIDLEALTFKRRARLGHYSLYVKGFRFDKVEKVAHVSQAGAIPASWLDLAGWWKARRSRGPQDDPGDPPDEFWRTLVADRGMHDRNPPYYYMRACKETIMKGGLRSNAVDTTALIYNERNSIITEFCRRVQSVIWNRALIRTKKGALGLVSEDVKEGDWVCIIYGCTVPVILRKGKWKTNEQRDDEDFEDRIEAMTRLFRKAAKQRARKARYKQLSTKPGYEAEIREKMNEYNTSLQERNKYYGEDKTDARSQSIWENGEDPKDDTDEDKSDEEIPNNIRWTKKQKKEAEDRARARDKQRQKDATRKDPYRHFGFMGEAYIHGMMDGDAVRKKFYNVKPDHVFEIR